MLLTAVTGQVGIEVLLDREGTLGKQIPFSLAGFGHAERADAADEYFTGGSVEKLMHLTIDYVGGGFADTVARAAAAGQN